MSKTNSEVNEQIETHNESKHLKKSFSGFPYLIVGWSEFELHSAAVSYRIHFPIHYAKSQKVKCFENALLLIEVWAQYLYNKESKREDGAAESHSHSPSYVPDDAGNRQLALLKEHRLFEFVRYRIDERDTRYLPIESIGFGGDLCRRPSCESECIGLWSCSSQN